MSLATGQNVRDYCQLDASVTNDMLIPHLNAAQRTLKDWVGTENYAEAEAAEETDQILKDLREAEAFLAYHFALDYIALRHTPEGITTAGKVGDGQYNYLGPKSIKELKERAWNRAQDAARPYMTGSVRFHLDSVEAEDETTS